MLLTIIVFLLILSLLVLIHEAGHFLVAKRLGIKVEEFGFGFPPRAFGIKKGETMYSINWLPIGGFVKLYGEDGPPLRSGSPRGLRPRSRNFASEGQAFFARPPWQRILVVVAGVVMNFLLSVVIISYLFGFVGVGVPGSKITVVEVAKNSPAYFSGIKAGDIIETINQQKLNSTEELINVTKKHLGEKIILKIKSNGVEKDIQITPRQAYPQNEGPLGVGISPNMEIKKYVWYQAPIAAAFEAFNESWLIIKGLGSVVFELVAHGVVPKGVAGPVGIAQLTGQFVQFGPLAVLSLVSLLSLNLAILNILPIPALDGGRLFFIIIEAVIGKKVNERFESLAHAAGMAILLTLIALITLHDLVRVFSGQPLLPKNP